VGDTTKTITIREWKIQLDPENILLTIKDIREAGRSFISGCIKNRGAIIKENLCKRLESPIRPLNILFPRIRRARHMLAMRIRENGG
jgi:hypothetical protein